MEALIYLNLMGVVLLFSVCGLVIVRRICDDARIQILLPASIITGIAVYIFLLNLTAYFVPGPVGFYVALALEVLVTYIIKRKIKPSKVIFPQNRERIVWLTFLLIWFVFLFVISATGSATSPDWQHNSYYASLLLRGDFPLHNPFQPDRLASYHMGAPIILGALRLFTGGADAFLGSTLSLITLFSISQILLWILKVKNNRNLLLLNLIPLVALVSLGNFMIVWPYQFSFPIMEKGIFNWLHNLPTLSNTYNAYGAPTSLDSLNLFLHRMLALAIFAALIPVILFANRSKKILSSAVSIALLAALMFADESVFIVAAPALLLILFFTFFQKKVKLWILFCLITLLIAVFQGGLASEAIFKSDATFAKVLLFPSDVKDPAVKFENYHTYRLEAQSSKLIPDKPEYKPLRWFHFGAEWQVGILLVTCFIFTLIFRRKLTDKSAIYLSWLFCISSVFALVAFHGIVPEGWTHINGNRFLALSYQLSGIGIIIFIILGWFNLKNRFVKFYFPVTIFLVWFLITSLLPPLVLLFPRQKLNWFDTVSTAEKPEYKWVKDSLSVSTRILPFMEKFPTSGPVLDLVRRAGVFVPVWYQEPQVQGFDVSPVYLDLFFTLNPRILQAIKLEYIMTNSLYRSTLPPERLADLNNREYFQVVYSDEKNDMVISKILPFYLRKAENYQGTFDDLAQILPSQSAVFIDSPPAINETVWRPIFLTLQMQNLKMYYKTNFLPVYNFIINVKLRNSGESNNKYNYIVLGPGTDPQAIVKGTTKLSWSHRSGYVKVWQVGQAP